MLYLAGSYDDYGPALHDAALATVTGEPLTADDGVSQVLEVALAVQAWRESNELTGRDLMRDGQWLDD